MIAMHNFTPPIEWQRRAEVRLTGMNIHRARELVSVMYGIWSLAAEDGWSRKWQQRYAVNQKNMRALLY